MELPLPPSTNNLYYTGTDGKRHLTTEAREYKKKVYEEVEKLVCVLHRKVPPPPFSVHMHIRFPDQRKADLSNRIKVVEDAIFGALGYDDRHVHDLHLWRYVCREDPGVAVEVRHSERGIEV